jgi:Uma2 family endonuclease
MSTETPPDDLRIIRRSDGLELDLEPLQGLWTVEQYLKLTDQTNHLIEFTDGMIERQKRLDYAEAGISEYWIVNPLDDTITVLVLAGAAMRSMGYSGAASTPPRNSWPVSA